MTADIEQTPIAEFWTSLETAVDPASYKPDRSTAVEVARLSNREEPYYVLKQPERKTYVRLSEEDYAMWWQMNGRNRIKDLLFYSLKRYKSLPVAHLTNVVNELLQAGFLNEQPTNLYDQIENQLEARAPESKGRQLLNAFLHTEIARDGLDPAFTNLYKWTRPLFFRVVQLLLLLIVISGGLLFIYLYTYTNPDNGEPLYKIANQGFMSVISLIVANLVVIGIHELAHGLATKHVGRELDRGGFLLYFGLPAFFVDTRDTWMSSNRERILVSWAGPYSGLLLGGVLSWFLTAVASSNPQITNSFLATFCYQVAFLAYFSVIINLNPLLELDGYFILIDWLEMPGLRPRAFRFWREEIWGRIKASGSPRQLWRDFNVSERMFTFFGALAFIYSLFALWLALNFWQARLVPFAQDLWQRGLWGRVILLVLTAILLIPTLYYLSLFLWNRIQVAIEWLARRDLLARPDVLALLIGFPILAGVPVLWLLSGAGLLRTMLMWGLYVVTAVLMVGVARQLPGSRFQWALYAWAAAPASLSLAVVSEGQTPWFELFLMAGSGAVLACGIVAWFTINSKWLLRQDWLVMSGFFLLGLLLAVAQWQVDPTILSNGRWLAAAFINLCVTFGLIFLTPMLLNFIKSRFALPWIILIIAILTMPWLFLFPPLLVPSLMLWLFAAALYFLLGLLAQFSRFEADARQTAVFSERELLVKGFNHFLSALFGSYELVFGGRWLTAVQAEIQGLGVLDLDLSILQIAERARHALLVAVDRLDDLAGTPFTRKAGSAAYDSLPWLEAETLSRHVLSNTQWGASLAQGFIRARDRRADLVKQADIFAGLDKEGVADVTAVLQNRTLRPGTTIAKAGLEATHFYLIESGEVAVLHEGQLVASLTTGATFGTNALAGSGNYNFTYRTVTAVNLLTLHRDEFDPLLRADTTLSQQVNSGVRERDLLKRMALFSSLSPQELATLDARLEKRQVKAGDLIVQQNEPRSYLFIVAQGAVEVFTSDKGTEHILGKLGPGEHFGEYALFADRPYRASLRAVLDTELLLLDEPKFDELVASYDRMTHYVEQIGSGRLLATQRHSALPS